jgi:hypothetical protein
MNNDYVIRMANQIADAWASIRTGTRLSMIWPIISTASGNHACAQACWPWPAASTLRPGCHPVREAIARLRPPP